MEEEREKAEMSGATPEFVNGLSKCQPALFTYISILLGGDNETAKDVLQEANLYIWNHRDSFDSKKSSFLTWAKTLAAIQVMKARNQALRERARTVYAEDVYDLVAARMAEEPEPSSDRIYALRECLKKLTARERRLLDLHYGKREKLESLAQDVRMTLAALKMKLLRLRGRLGRCIVDKLCRIERGEEEPPDSPTDFDAALSDLLDTARPRDFAALDTALRAAPEKLDDCLLQMCVHALLAYNAGENAAKSVRQRDTLRRFAGAALRPALAAAALLTVFLGGRLWLARQPTRENRRATIAVGSNRTKPKAVEKAAAEPLPPTEPPLKRAPDAFVAAAPAPAPVFVTNQTLAVEKPQPKKEEEKTMNATLAKINTLAATATVAAAMSAGVSPQTALATDNVPVVSNVTFKQPFGTRVLEIGYTLENGPGIVTLDITTNGVSIGDANLHYLSGEVNKVVPNGTYTVLWDTKYAWPNHTNEQARAVVTAWATNCPPDYMVVALDKGTNSAYYTSADALPGGVTNDLYRTTRLVLRKISAAGVTWTMGQTGELVDATLASHSVTLSNDYYIGIFEITQTQWSLFKSNPSVFKTLDFAKRPVDSVSFYNVRESTDNKENTAYQYPNPPNPSSFLGLLRARTGLAFDLPGEAQWEFACRAGNGSGKWGDGSDISFDETDSHLALIGRYKFNGGFVGGTNTPAATCSADNGSAMVGSYKPNDWGIYDMHGNLWEWCLDWYAADITQLNGAVNTNKVTKHVERSGSWYNSSPTCRSASRYQNFPDYGSNSCGLRVALTLLP